MRQIRSMPIAVMACALIAAQPQDAQKSELAKLEGNWQMTSQEWLGRVSGKRTVEKSRLIIEGTEFAWHDTNIADSSLQTAEITLDPTKNPKTIDARFTKGSHTNKTVLGIYKLQGDKLEICWGEAGSNKRPTKYTTKPGVGSGELWSTYTREKE